MRPKYPLLRPHRIALALFCTAVLWLAASCSAEQRPNASASVSSGSVSASVSSASVSSASVSSASVSTPHAPGEIELDDYYFEPREITVTAGEEAHFTLKNEGQAAHTFTIEALGIDVTVEPGAEERIEIDAATPGDYEIACRFHEDRGMVGTLHVRARS